MKFADIIDGLKEGKKYQRIEAWIPRDYIFMNDATDIWLMHHFDNLDCESDHLITVEELLARDWYEVEFFEHNGKQYRVHGFRDLFGYSYRLLDENSRLISRYKVGTGLENTIEGTMEHRIEEFKKELEEHE